MAKQKGIVKLEGSIEGITFYKTEDGYLAKAKSSVSANKVKNSSTFQRTQENMQEFTTATKAGKFIRDAIRPYLQLAKDSKITSRLVKEIYQVILSDTTSIRGQRNIVNGHPALLEGFECNRNAVLSSILSATYAPTIDRGAGSLKVVMQSFVPKDAIIAPQGATHFRLVVAGCEIDFSSGQHIADYKDSGLMPLDNRDSGAILLDTEVGSGRTAPLFLFLGIQFFEFVNGTHYPLNNGSYNALKLVKVME